MQVAGRGCSHRGNSLCKGPGLGAWPGVMGIASQDLKAESGWHITVLQYYFQRITLPYSTLLSCNWRNCVSAHYHR